MKTLLSFTVIALMFTAAVWAGSPRTFTNEDIEKYKGDETTSEDTPSDNTPPPTVTKSEPRRSSNDNQQAEKDYWCNRATQAQNRLDQAYLASANATTTKITIRGTYGRSYRGADAVANASIEADKAENEVRAAKADLEQIEDEAHRKGILPGWLRCQ